MSAQAALASVRKLQECHDHVVDWYTRTFVGSEKQKLSRGEWRVLVNQVQHRQRKENRKMDDLCTAYHEVFPALVEEIDLLRAYQKEHVDTWATAVYDAVSGVVSYASGALS